MAVTSIISCPAKHVCLRTIDEGLVLVCSHFPFDCGNSSRVRFGEEPEKAATTSKEGSRRANYPILTRGVKKLVVEPWDGSPVRPASTGRLVPSVGDALLVLTDRDFDPIVLAFGIGVMINRDSRGHSYFIVREAKVGARRRSDTALVSTINDADQGSADVAFRTPLAPYEKSKFLGSGGSMVARLKLKGIDGRAPPGVEPAA
ncbi:hypothetical protein Bca4012_103131 [Brassica carinata]